MNFSKRIFFMRERTVSRLLIKEFLEALLRGKKHSVHSVIPAKAGMTEEKQPGFRIKCGMTKDFFQL
jgi:hypothetical protein